MRSKKSIKQDRSRIALTQRHEVQYLKRIAKEQLTFLKKQKGKDVWGLFKKDSPMCSKAKLIRICRGLIKCLNKL